MPHSCWEAKCLRWGSVGVAHLQECSKMCSRRFQLESPITINSITIMFKYVCYTHLKLLIQLIWTKPSNHLSVPSTLRQYPRAHIHTLLTVWFCSPIFHSVLAVVWHVLGGASPPGAWVWFFEDSFFQRYIAPINRVGGRGAGGQAKRPIG